MALGRAAPAPRPCGRAGGAPRAGLPRRAERRDGPAVTTCRVGPGPRAARRGRRDRAHDTPHGRGGVAGRPRRRRRPRRRHRPGHGRRAGRGRRRPHPALQRGRGTRPELARGDPQLGEPGGPGARRPTCERHGGVTGRVRRERARRPGRPRCAGRMVRRARRPRDADLGRPSHARGRLPRPHRTEPAMSELSTAPPAPAAATAWRRVVSQGAFETRMILRNGEQLLVTIFLPVLVLVGLARSGVVELSTGGAARIDVVAPGVLALAVMSTAFTSQAIATSFDRRNGVLRLLSTTPLGRGGLLAGKFLGVAAVEAVQVVVIGGTGLALGWRPVAAGIPLGVVVPVSQLPGPLEHVARLLPSGALGEALRGALLDGALPAWSVVVLLAWTAVLAWAAARLFRWH